MDSSWKLALGNALRTPLPLGKAGRARDVQGAYDLQGAHLGSTLELGVTKSHILLLGPSDPGVGHGVSAPHKARRPGQSPSSRGTEHILRAS